MKVADEGHIDAARAQSLCDVWNRSGGSVIVDRYAHEFGALLGEGGYLFDRLLDISRVGVGHRLHHDRMTRPHRDLPDPGGNCLSAYDFCHSV